MTEDEIKAIREHIAIPYADTLGDAEQLLAEVERLRAALALFADEENWGEGESSIGIPFLDWQGSDDRQPWEIAADALGIANPVGLA